MNAPSESNSQPWRFEVKGNQINVIALPEKDHPILNYRCRMTWVAHGGLIENILIAALQFGYLPRFRIFPDKNNLKLTAQIVLERKIIEEDSLFEAIRKRTTNRNRYKDKPLSSGQKLDILNSVQEVGGGRLELLADKNKMIEVGEAMSVNEIVVFENETLHKFFFDRIVWSAKEEKEKGSGLYLKTMGLKGSQKLAFRLFKKWKRMEFANKIGMSRRIAKDNAKIYSSGSAIGAIIVSDDDKDFITAGRLMERVWLKTSKNGLGFHLMAGTLFFHQRIKTGETKEFLSGHIKLIEDAYKKVASIFGVSGNKLIALIFRIGYGNKVEAYSYKKPPEIKFLD